MRPLDEFHEFIQPGFPLAPLTWFRLGGPAEFLARPQTVPQLAALIRRCAENAIPCRILASGSNVLVRDEGVEGVVVHLESPAFSDVSIDGSRVTCGSAVPLTALISQTARAGLGGIEMMTGIPGTVGGAVRGNAGSRQDAIAPFVRSIDVIDSSGQSARREHDDLNFGYRTLNLDDPVIVSVTFELAAEDTESVVKRMRRVWIIKKENQPYGHQRSGMIFKDPAADVSARMLIDQAGLKGEKVGGAEVSERQSNFFIAQPGATAADVLGLIALVRRRVLDQLGYDLEPQIQAW